MELFLILINISFLEKLVWKIFGSLGQIFVSAETEVLLNFYFVFSKRLSEIA